MDFEKIFRTPEDKLEFLYRLNMLTLQKRPHIKNYNKLRKLHSEIIDNMLDYIYTKKYNINEELKSLNSNGSAKIKDIQLTSLDLNNSDDITIFADLFIYSNHPNLKSVTEVYLEKNKFKNKEKLNMLNAMKNSYASLFKVIKTDRENAYVYYQDVFTNKVYKIIDISLSISYKPSNKKPLYVYNRIIPIDKDTYFGTGIHCMLRTESKELTKCINKYKNKNLDKIRMCMCLELYELSKKEKNLVVSYRNSY